MRYKVTSVGQNTGAAYPRTLTAGERISHKALRTSHFNVYSSLGWWSIYSRYVVMVSDHYRIRTCAIEGSMVDEPNERAQLFTSEPTHPNSSCNACLQAQTVLHSSEGGLYPHDM